MRISDQIYFSDAKKLLDMETCSKEEWTDEWIRRLVCYYFEPAKMLIDQGKGFSALIIICSLLEAVGTIQFSEIKGPGIRFENTFKLFFHEGNLSTFSSMFYSHYRCGLVHNGRTNQSFGYRKKLEFSVIDFDSPRLFAKEKENFFVVNPTAIYGVLEREFSLWIQANKDAIGDKVIKEFKSDIELLKRD